MTGSRTKAGLQLQVNLGRGFSVKAPKGLENQGTERTGRGSEREVQGVGAQDCGSNYERAILSMAKQDRGDPSRRNQNLYYTYYRDRGHTTEQYRVLKDQYNNW